MSKTFSHAGVSRLNGEMKFRVANDALRVKVLSKNGHKDIDIIELKNPMTKEEAVAFLLSIDFATRDGVTNQEVKAALEAEQTKRQPKAASEPKVKAAPKVKAKPTMDSIKSKITAKKAAAPKSTITRAEIESQLKEQTTDSEFEEAPF